MLTFPAERAQGDDRQDEYSAAAAISFDGVEDMARQEFRDEADINIILKKFGATAPQRPLVFGEADYDMDLQTAMLAIDAAKDIHLHLGPALQEKYPTWQDVLNGVATGQLRIDLRNEEPKVSTPVDNVTPT